MERIDKEWRVDSDTHREGNNNNNNNNNNNEPLKEIDSLTKSSSSDEIDIRNSRRRGSGLTQTHSDDGMVGMRLRRPNLVASRSGDGTVDTNSRTRQPLGKVDASSRARLLVASRGWESFSTRNLNRMKQDDDNQDERDAVTAAAAAVAATATTPGKPSRPTLLGSGAKNWESYRGSCASSRALILLQSRGSERIRDLRIGNDDEYPSKEYPARSSRPSLLSTGTKDWESYRGSRASSRALLLLQSSGSESFRNVSKSSSSSESTYRTDSSSSSSNVDDESSESIIDEEDEDETEVTDAETIPERTSKCGVSNNLPHQHTLHHY